MTLQVNYDAVAGSYDQRTSDGSYLRDVTLALQMLARQINAGRVLDMGCGTGRSLVGLAGQVHAFGLDFSAGMLRQAHRLRRDFRLVRASAPTPPLAAASFELVTSVMSFHHFPHKEQVIREAFRLLRPGGALAIVNFDPAAEATRWFIYDYFPETAAIDQARFPAGDWLQAQLLAAGFERVSGPLVEHVHGVVHGRAILNDYWLQKNSMSQLILLPNEAYQAGLQRIHAALAASEAVTFETNLQIHMWHGFKPLEC